MLKTRPGTLAFLKPAIDDGETAELFLPSGVVHHVHKTESGYVWRIRGIPKRIGEPEPTDSKDFPYSDWEGLLKVHDPVYIQSKCWRLVQ